MLEIKNLTKKYTNNYIFRDFSYQFKSHGTYLITGKSGSGKTTLMRIICGLDKKYDGEITGGGVSNCSVAFQEYRLFEQLSTVENVYLENEKESARAKDLLLSLGFTDDDCRKSARELSGGMKQRVSIARAIFKSSPVLCLDEPTKEIGKENVKRLAELIAKEAEKRLVIVITHTVEDFSTIKFTQITL